MKASSSRCDWFIRGLALAMVLAASMGAAATTLSASTLEACAGLNCYDGSDCGSYCFCNRPSGACFLDVP